MTTPRDTPASRRTRANGDGTIYQRKDSRWEAAGYVLAPGNTRKRIRVYGTTRKEALAKLTEKIVNSNRGLPVPSAQGTLAAYLTYWLENVTVHHLRENTHTRYTACVNRYLIPGLGKKKLAKLTAKDVRTWLNQLRTTCQCCTRGIDVGRDEPRCCAVGACCSKRLSPLTLAYIHSVLKSALEHAVREEEIPRNVARNVRTGTPRPWRFEPLTADEARQFLTASRDHRLHALLELALRTGLRKGELLGLYWEDIDLDAGTAAIRPHPPTHQRGRAQHPAYQEPGLRTPHRPPRQLPALSEASPRTAAGGAGRSWRRMAGERARFHHAAGQADRPNQPHPYLHHAPPQGRPPPHPLP